MSGSVELAGGSLRIFHSHKNVFLTAAESGDHELLKRLVEKGSDINRLTKTGKHNSLHTVASKGNLKAVQALIKAGANVNALGTDGFSALMLACQSGSLEVVEFLLARAEPDLTFQTKPPAKTQSWLGGNEKPGLGGHTCLHLAVFSNKVEIVKLLLKNGADGAAVADQGYTALHIAAEQSSVEMLKVVIQLIPLLHLHPPAGWGGVLDASKLHIYRFSPQTADGKTALHLAVEKNDADKVRVLLEASPDAARIKDKDGYTALHRAIKHGHTEIVSQLLQHAIDVNTVVNGHTPLQDAVYSAGSEVVSMLLKQGANPRVTNEDGETLVMSAARGYDQAKLALLIEAVRIPRKSVSEGYTDCKTDWINRTDKDGHTALYYAEQYGRQEHAAMLKAAGANDTILCQNTADPQDAPLHGGDCISEGEVSLCAGSVSTKNGSSHSGSVSFSSGGTGVHSGELIWRGTQFQTSTTDSIDSSVAVTVASGNSNDNAVALESGQENAQGNIVLVSQSPVAQVEDTVVVEVDTRDTTTTTSAEASGIHLSIMVHTGRNPMFDARYIVHSYTRNNCDSDNNCKYERVNLALRTDPGVPLYQCTQLLCAHMPKPTDTSDASPTTDTTPATTTSAIELEPTGKSNNNANTITACNATESTVQSVSTGVNITSDVDDQTSAMAGRAAEKFSTRLESVFQDFSEKRATKRTEQYELRIDALQRQVLELEGSLSAALWLEKNGDTTNSSTCSCPISQGVPGADANKTFLRAVAGLLLLITIVLLLFIRIRLVR